MKFRFTLSNPLDIVTTAEDTIISSAIPAFNLWTNSGTGKDWNIDTSPDIDLDAIDGLSKFLKSPTMTFEVGETYSIILNFTKIYTSGPQTGTHTIQLMVSDVANSVIESVTQNTDLNGEVGSIELTFVGTSAMRYLQIQSTEADDITNIELTGIDGNVTGTVTTEAPRTLEISEPDGWKDTTMKLQRDKEFHSLIEFFDGSFIFYGKRTDGIDGGIWQIKRWERQYGPDAKIQILIEYTRDNFHFFTVFTGQLDISLAEEMVDNKMRIPIIRDDFWAKFFSRKDTPVDLQATVDLDGVAITPVEPIDLSLISQVIRKGTNYKGFATLGDYDFDASGDLVDTSSPPATTTEEIILWSQATTIRDSGEIKDSFEVGLVFQDTEPIINIIEIIDEEGEIDVEWGFRFAFSIDLRYIPISTDASMINDVNIATQLYYRINNGSLVLLETQGDTVDFNPPYAFTPGIQKQLTGNFSIDLEGTTTIDVLAGDQVYFYAKHTVTFTYIVGDDDPNSATWVSRSITGFISNVNGSDVEPFVNFLFQSVFRDTVCPGFLVHDSAAAIIKSHGLGVENPFYSEHFGGLLTNARQYPSDGCMWNHANAKGLHVRGYTLAEKSYSMSFMQWWRGMYPIFNLGLSYDEIEGSPISGWVPQELPPLSFYGASGALNPDLVWTGGISQPFLTIASGVSVNEESRKFGPPGYNIEEGHTYKYQYQYTTTIDSGTEDFDVYIQIVDIGGTMLIESVEHYVATTGTSPNPVGEYEFVAPAGSDRFLLKVVFPNGTSDTGLFTINSFVDLTESEPDTEGGQQPVIIVEPVEEFYDEDFILELSNIRKITRNYDTDKIYNKIEIGYTEWKAEATAGIDDPQTKHTYATRFEKIGQSISLLSDWIAASIPWEETRRASIEKSKDYKFDENTFIVRLNPNDISPDTYVPAFDEDFISITNLFNPDRRYNIALSVARNFLRFRKWFNGCLQSYVSSVYKFVSGEGNYKMTSQMIEDSPSCSDEDYDGLVLAEDQNIDVTDEVIHLINHYTIEHPMSMLDYLKAARFRKKAIGVSLTTTDHVAFFIEELGFKPVKGNVTVTGWTKAYLDIHVIEGVAPTQSCIPTTECDNALTDEFGEILTDENGVCLTI